MLKEDPGVGINSDARAAPMDAHKSYLALHSIGEGSKVPWSPRPSTVCAFLGVEAALLAAAAFLYCCLGNAGKPGGLGCLACLRDADSLLREENQRLQGENSKLRQDLKDEVKRRKMHPYEVITGSAGHQLPRMYGKVREKTIWSYWHDPVACPNSMHCTLPPQVQLCVETVATNKGSFDYRIVHMDEVEDYVNWFELPVHWMKLTPPHQKDALMNALLARYGGVAMDISTILLRPIDDYWEELIRSGATFRGYMYRLNGRPWRHAEVTVVWFLMARREGIFSTAVRNQVIGMGDRTNTRSYHHWYLALGDQTLLPILSMFNYTLPKCYMDPTIRNYHKFPDQNPEWCPENEQPPWYKGITGPPRNDTRILLRDPRDGPQLPFAFMGMVAWHVDDNRTQWKTSDFQPGAPMHRAECTSAKSCWDDVFLTRYNQPRKPGEARLLSFVKLFHHGNEFAGKTRADLLADKNTFFYHWLKLAGLPGVA